MFVGSCVLGARLPGAFNYSVECAVWLVPYLTCAMPMCPDFYEKSAFFALLAGFFHLTFPSDISA